MNIVTRPHTYSAVGGRLPNPITYRISTASAFVQATIFRADGSEISKVKAATRAGVATLDISSFLRSQMQLSIPSGTLAVEEATGSYLGFYCTFQDAEGQTLSDSANVRYAVAAALSVGTSDYSGYSIV